MSTYMDEAPTLYFVERFHMGNESYTRTAPVNGDAEVAFYEFFEGSPCYGTFGDDIANSAWNDLMRPGTGPNYVPTSIFGWSTFTIEP